MSTEPSRPLWARLRAEVRRRFEQLKNEQATPERLGVAVAVGVFCGLSPLIGLQTVLALALAFLLRLNKLAVLIGLQISFPPLMPFLVLGEIELGELILRGAPLPLTVDRIRGLTGRQIFELFFLDLTVGGLIFGVVFGALFGVATTAWIRRRRRARQPGPPQPGPPQPEPPQP